jgi:hypothetical protein
VGRGDMVNLFKFKEKQKEATKFLGDMAGSVDKEYFLNQLREEWKGNLAGTNFNIEKQADKALKNIKMSGMKFVFDRVGITREDLIKVLEEIKNNGKLT